MGSDIALHNNVRNVLGRLLGPLAQRLCVIVANGVVTLTGELDSVDERIVASSAIRQLPGVRALAVGIQVSPRPSGNP
ncbi:MAG TPA: BON domain-containing protein [Gemmatimonadaceae bacterium]|nr:BON domain-containing protein [Gemmatimonadaceae bacterium]